MARVLRGDVVSAKLEPTVGREQAGRRPVVVVSALVSAAQYFLRFWSHVDDRIKQRRKLRLMEARKKTEDAVPL